MTLSSCCATLSTDFYCSSTSKIRGIAVVLEPKRAVVEYGRRYRPHIKFVEGEVENIPLSDEYFDKVVASASFHHFPNQDRGLEEMKRILKSNGKMTILEIDPTTRNGCTQEPNFMNHFN